MQRTTARFPLPLRAIHWLLVVLITITIGLGAYLQTSLPAVTAREYLANLHNGLGLLAATLILFQMLLSLFLRPRLLQDNVRWRPLASRMYFPLYGFTLVAVISAYLHIFFTGATPAFGSFSIPVTAVSDPVLSEFFSTTHNVLGLATAITVVLHLLLSTIGKIKRADLTALEQLATDEAKTKALLTLSVDETSLATSLAGSLRRFGWSAFLLQTLLAIVCGLLLVVATSGRTVSPDAVGAGDAMFWATGSFLFLCTGILLAFRYTRAAPHLGDDPRVCLDGHRKTAFWFLNAGQFNGLAGIILAVIGLALSISLLVAKTVSQPPGIAITDPNKIVRALDVFVLIVNFTLLMAHFVATAISFWLGLRVSKTRQLYRQAQVPPEPHPSSYEELFRTQSAS